MAVSLTLKMDTLETAEDFAVGKNFPSFETLQSEIFQYGTLHSFIFVKGDCRRSKTGGEYDYVTFVCKQGGKVRPSRSRGLRPNQSTIKCGCPVSVRARAIKSCERQISYTITRSMLEHNHEISENSGIAKKQTTPSMEPLKISIKRKEQGGTPSSQMKQTKKSRRLQLQNPHIVPGQDDVLYHLALGNKSHDLSEMFHDVKFVCLGGSPNRMQQFAESLVSELELKIPAGQGLTNIAAGSDRYVLYKVGPVLSVSHGMGIPSLSILFHELVKLIYHAGCTDVIFFRIGTSGGLGLEPGSLVITDEAVDGLLRPYMEVATLGKLKQHPSHLDQDLAEELLVLADQDFINLNCETFHGKTMCTYDFYEGQARLDGAFCSYEADDKMTFLRNAFAEGVLNIEMESLCFASMCHRAGIRGAVVCVTLLDRLKGDQISTPHEILEEWQRRPQKLVASFIKQKLGIR